MRSLSKIVLVMVVFLLSIGNVLAQGTDLGTIRGTVTDKSGGLIPGATVKIEDLGTNLSRQFTTDGQGDYEAAGLRSGNYKVTISFAGFNTVEVSSVVLRSSAVERVDAKLTPAGTSTSIVITSEAPRLNTESQVISATLDNRALVQLPRDNRDIYSFLYLNPNITQGANDGAFKFIGNQTYGAAFSLDGQRSNGGVFGEPTASQPSLEAVGELTVMSNDFSAEYGGIANIRVETKRGQNAYHGSLFYNNKNSALAAWNYNDKIGQANFIPNAFQSSYPNPYLNLNEFGGSLGGRVPKIKNTFFMIAYEGRRFRQPVSSSSSTLPHPSLWAGDFSGLNDSKKPKVPAGAALTPAEIATDTVGGLGVSFITIPQRLLNPVVQNFIGDYFPKISTAYPINASNGRLPNYFNIVPGSLTRNLGTMRVDHDFSEKNKIYGVYNVAPQDSRMSRVVNPYDGLGLLNRHSMNHTVSLAYTHLFSNNLINEARGGFNKQASYVRSNQTLEAFLTNIGFDSSDVTAYGAVVGPENLKTYGHPAITWGSGFANFTNGGRNTDRPLDQALVTLGDTLSWVKGRHSIRMGGDLVRNAAADGFSANRGNPRGLMTYAGTGPQAFSDWLLGRGPTTSARYNTAIRGPMHVYNWEEGFFVQDDFRVHSRLTLNLGVRYEIITPFIEDDNLLVNFDPTFVDPTTGTHGRFIVPSQDVLSRVDPRMIAYGTVTADKLGLPRSLVRTDYTKVAPRIGVAWRLSGKSVLRGGYGFYFPTSAAQGMRDAMATNPFNQTLTVDNNGAAIDGWPGFTHGFSPISGGHLRTLGGQPSANVLPFDLKEPRIEQYNVTFEREIGFGMSLRASYLGTRMHDLITGRDLNMLPPSDIGWSTTTGDGVTPCDPVDAGDCAPSDADLARLPFPNLGSDLSSFGNFGHGRSNALQLEAKRRYSGGFMFDANYTWLSQKATAVDSANASLGGTAYNQFKPNDDYGIDSYIPSQRFIFYSLWELPVGRGRKFAPSMSKVADAVIGGWQTSWQWFAKSGTGFTPYWYCDDCSNIGTIFPGNIASDFLDAIGDFNGTSFRPLLTGQNPQQRSGDLFFNPAAFDVPTVGADLLDNPKVAKRNLLHGPGTWGVNLGLHKTFRLTEKVQGDVGAEFNNLFNHPLFSPDSNGQDGDFSNLGSFNVRVDPATLKLLPIDPADVTRNDNFGRLLTSYTQEGVDSRRTIRLKLRITF